ncbi:hypothetical protein HO133_006948 [Letharia lupina]|uniref:FAD-binding domain-containing protein n=1 Tax=Letharia lupina TaxID=560253 RepID=A0A8H6CSR7_9LECA|nr:uncharacterized protein HO133_006948 [Letharia lupina]KAF6228837.1 hypothetical protein HO133_006948 [Letharia lupina]
MGSIPHATNGISSSEKAIRLAIIGGGIGGLCLAIGLLKQPHVDVQVYEAASTFSEIGAGVVIGNNAERALQLIGSAAWQAMEKHATRNLWSSHSDIFQVFRVGVGEKEGALISAPKNRSQSVHRARFLDELVKQVPAQRAHFNKRLQDLEETEDGVILHFNDGTTATADVAIGADGVHSRVRELLVGEEAAKPVFSGAVIYRGLLPMDRAIEVIGPEDAQNAVVLCGPGQVALSYPIDFGKNLNCGVFHFGLKKWPHEKWIVPADHEELTSSFKDWGEPARKIVKLLNLPTVSAWALFDSPPAPFFHRGRVAMMGDAAHATTPFQGQGAGQAIEDACVLSALFTKVVTPKDVPTALAAYDQIRRPRSQRVVQTSRETGHMLSMQLPGVGDDVEKMKQYLDTSMHWIWDRDLVAQNEDAVKLFEKLRCLES